MVQTNKPSQLLIAKSRSLLLRVEDILHFEIFFSEEGDDVKCFYNLFT